MSTDETVYSSKQYNRVVYFKNIIIKIYINNHILKNVLKQKFCKFAIYPSDKQCILLFYFLVYSYSFKTLALSITFISKLKRYSYQQFGKYCYRP